MKYKPGQKYYLRYYNFHVDPMPFLYVIHSDRKLTEGFNLHYLPNIRFRVPVEIYKRMPEETFRKAFETMTGAGLFRGFLKKLDDASNSKSVTKREMRVLSNHLMDKYKWSKLCYRRYHTNKLKVRQIIQW